MYTVHFRAFNAFRDIGFLMEVLAEPDLCFAAGSNTAVEVRVFQLRESSRAGIIFAWKSYETRVRKDTKAKK